MRLTFRTTLARAERGVSYLAVLLAITSAVLSVVTNVSVEDEKSRDAAKVACQTQINQEFLATLKTRSNISNESTANINNFVVALINSKNNTPAENQKIINSYLTELAKTNAELKSATYPSIGDC